MRLPQAHEIDGGINIVCCSDDDENRSNPEMLKQLNMSQLTPQRLLRLSLLSLPIYPSLGGVGIAVILLVETYRKYPKIFQIPISRIIGPLSLLMILSCIFAENKSESILQLFNFFPFFLFFYVCLSIFSISNNLEKISLDFIVSSTFVSALGFLEYSLSGLRSSSIFDNPNVLASYLLLSLGVQLGFLLDSLTNLASEQILDNLTLAKLLRGGLTRSVILALLVTLTQLAINSSGSRGGFYIAMVEVSIFILAATWILAQKSLILFSSFIIIAAGWLYQMNSLAQVWFPRVATATSARAVSSDLRLDIWRVALDMIQKRPIFGWGLGSYKFIYPSHPFRSDVPTTMSHAHNFWLLLGSEAGLLVTALFTVLVGLIYVRGIHALWSKRLMHSERFLLAGYLLAFSGCVLYGLLDCTFYDVRVNVMNWLMLICIHVMTRYSQQERPRNIAVDTPPLV